MSFIQRLQVGLCAWGLATAACAQNPTITIAAEDDWAPYSSMKADKSGPEGFSPDLVRAVFKLKGVDVKMVAVPFVRCLQMVKTAKAVACFDTTITDENKDEFYWHKTPIFEEGLAIFALADTPQTGLTTLGLEGGTVGITTGYTYPTDFMQNKKIKKFEANSDEHLLKMLLAKRVQYVILNTMPGMLRIKNDASLSGKVKQVGLISKDGFWLNFSKTHPDGKRMADLFEAGLLELKASGRYDKMYADFKQRLGLPR
ncbi:substrate-binding periplasmic protein [Rhodoferax sp. WC2427]|uniref:substrate-binding periplasmic protein n=1 Tax=Rhodoferax sp. WC2427 TaxID=3234144 RepID=UPI003466211E